MPIQLTLKNTDGSQTIVVGRKNTLTLTLTNAGAGDVPLIGGQAVTQDGAATGPSALYLNFADVLTGAALRPEINPPAGWTATYLTTPSPAWALTPDQSRVLLPGGTVKFTIDNVVPVKAKKDGRIIVDTYKIGAPSASSALPMDAVPPAGIKELKIAFVQTDPADRVVISEPGAPFDNRIGFTISNPSYNDPLVPAEVRWGAQPPQFFIRCVAGTAPGRGALTTAEVLARNSVRAEIDRQYGDRWKIDKNVEAKPPFWTLTPLEHEVLGAREKASVQFRISGIVTAFEPGATQLYLEWKNIPGYEDGGTALLVKKVPKVGIDRFETAVNILNFDSGPAEVPFSWKVRHGVQVQINSRTVATSPDAAPLEGTDPVHVGGPGEVPLTATGEGRGNVAYSRPIVMTSIRQYVNGKRFTGARQAAAHGTSPSGWTGDLQDSEDVNYIVNETLTIDTSGSATYSFSAGGSGQSHVWILEGKGMSTWQLRHRSGSISSNGSYTGASSIAGNALTLTTGNGEVLRFAFACTGPGTGTLTLTAPIASIKGVIVDTKAAPATLKP